MQPRSPRKAQEHIVQTDANCIFCKIVAGAIPCFKLYEDTDTLAFMDINPLNPGHCLVIPKEHAPDIFAIGEIGIAKTVRVTRVLARAVQAALKPAGMNVLQANGPGAAQSVPHFHFHILPRRLDDDAKLNWTLVTGDLAAISALAESIRRHIDP
jgi:histidine triad (HIT) family protein